MNNPVTHRIVQLIIATQEGKVSADESAELAAWASQSPANQAFIDRCQDREATAQALADMERIDSDGAFRRFKDNYLEELYVAHPLPKRSIVPWLAAATVLGLALITGWWFFLRKDKATIPVEQTAQVKPVILPVAGNMATLTLSDGHVISLNDSKDGLLVQEAGTKVNKKGDALEYQKDGTSPDLSLPLVYNTVTTPKGGFYKLLLPDQSSVWLNAESSIRFPTTFADKERKVTITGEVYFEIAKRTAQPFIVAIDGGMTVKVLGTHFNINAYKDMPSVKTTLLEGKIEVTKGGQPIAIKPGQQAVANAGTSNILVKEVSIEDVVAWKDGYFSFNKASVADIMREAKRWYDIDVEYQSEVEGAFIAYLPRNLPLNSLLNILEATDKVKFRVEGKKIIIMK